MATRSQLSTNVRRRRQRSAHLDFAAIEIIGSLMTPDAVARIAAFEAQDQSEESYGIPPGLRLRDEIARYYRIGEALWLKFSQSSAVTPESSAHFVNSLLQHCFGFDSIHPALPIH